MRRKLFIIVVVAMLSHAVKTEACTLTIDDTKRAYREWKVLSLPADAGRPVLQGVFFSSYSKECSLRQLFLLAGANDRIIVTYLIIPATGSMRTSILEEATGWRMIVERRFPFTAGSMNEFVKLWNLRLENGFNFDVLVSLAGDDVNLGAVPVSTTESEDAVIAARLLSREGGVGWITRIPKSVVSTSGAVIAAIPSPEEAHGSSFLYALLSPPHVISIVSGSDERWPVRHDRAMIIREGIRTINDDEALRILSNFSSVTDPRMPLPFITDIPKP